MCLGSLFLVLLSWTKISIQVRCCRQLLIGQVIRGRNQVSHNTDLSWRTITTVPGADLTGALAGDNAADFLAGDSAGDHHHRHRSSRWSVSPPPVDLLHCCGEALIQHHDKLEACPQTSRALSDYTKHYSLECCYKSTVRCVLCK